MLRKDLIAAVAAALNDAGVHHEMLKAVAFHTVKGKWSAISDTKIAEAILDLITDQVALGLKEGGEVKVSGFGNFVARKSPPRLVRDPRNGNEITTKPTTRVSFRASKILRGFVTSEGSGK